MFILRIDAYWAQKAQLIAQGIIPDNKGRWRTDKDDIIISDDTETSLQI